MNVFKSIILTKIKNWIKKKIHRYQYAIPQYSFESEKKVLAIAEVEKANPGLILAGNIRDGIGMSDRIKQGRIIAEQLIT